MSMDLKGKKWFEVGVCPSCNSEDIVIATYKNGERFLECNNDMAVICEIPKKNYGKDRLKWVKLRKNL